MSTVTAPTPSPQARSNKNVKSYDVVIWGATAFTGKLVCRHMAENYQGKLNWAMAGRNRAKLEAVRREIAEFDSDAESVPIITADLEDESSMDQMVSQSKVVASIVGPYARFGTPLVEACIRNSTHYCDLTGEVPWVKQTIDRFHGPAQESKTRIVNMCGFDSVPFDMSTFLVADHARKQYGRKLKEVQVLLSNVGGGGVSGGTIASLSGLSDIFNSSEVNKYLQDGLYLVPPELRTGRQRQISDKLLRYLPQADTWAVLSPFTFLNTPTVYRSAALLDYGEQFSYGEGIQLKEIVPGIDDRNLGFLAGCAMLGAYGAAVGVSQIPGAVSYLRDKVLPRPGTGPSFESLEQGYWELRAIGEMEGDQEPKYLEVRAGDLSRDGGYWSTSRMILEAALCMAIQEEDLLNEGCPKGGVLTPAAALGSVFLQRLRAAGIFFNVVGGI
eukprot:TRINITY_DN740_c4_g1_i3.p1 TRINITY_DN740_c4_g1~~TRINITY_DN740_c4_g1_i3.p1  ORF type:complete len:465 (-),score=65.66 TRINITY_DN740_c4_g1_i3:180-1508(-)